ncbi:MAG: outer membrane beta-barrel protein [Burkholderiales bacterium]
MNKLVIALAALAALVSSSAMAQGADPLMFGGKAGFFKPDGPGSDNGFSVGAVLGKRVQGNVSWEAELNLAIMDGEAGGNADYEINSVAGYAVYRTEGNTHLKAKMGVGYWDDDFDKDFSLTMGIGLGFRMGRGILDVEYTQINDFVDYITVGYILPF